MGTWQHISSSADGWWWRSPHAGPQNMSAGGGTQDLAADIALERESFGLNYPHTYSGTPHFFFFF